MYPVDARSAPLTLRFSHIPDGWHIATPLTPSSAGEFTAANYDRLVDSPVEIGNFAESDFDEAGGHFRVIVDADPADYDMAKIVAALHKIYRRGHQLDERPSLRHLHVPLSLPARPRRRRHGTRLLHRHRFECRRRCKQSLDPFTGVTSHEFFHLWNVKRIRPQTLEPIDYTKENYTRALWFSEGVTSTAEGIIQLRAGLIDEKQYLRRTQRRNHRTRTPPRAPHAVRGRVQPRCLARRQHVTTAVPSAAFPTTTKANCSA